VRGERLADARDEDGVAVQRLASATQDDGIAALDGERGDVHRDVRAGLVDDAQHAERHAALHDVHAVGARGALQRLPHRVRQGRDVLHVGRDALQAVRGEREAVHERGVQSGRLRGLHVERVGGQDFGRVGAEAGGDLAQRGVLLFGGQHAQAASGPPGGFGHLTHGQGGGKGGGHAFSIRRSRPPSAGTPMRPSRAGRVTAGSGRRGARLPGRSRSRGRPACRCCASRRACRTCSRP